VALGDADADRRAVLGDSDGEAAGLAEAALDEGALGNAVVGAGLVDAAGLLPAVRVSSLGWV
jgi:hypothetical protein